VTVIAGLDSAPPGPLQSQAPSQPGSIRQSTSGIPNRVRTGVNRPLPAAAQRFAATMVLMVILAGAAGFLMGA